MISSLTHRRCRNLFVAASLASATLAANAAIIRADFTGTITNSYDSRLDSTQPVGMLFGGSTTMGQRSISGSIYFNDAVYSDTNPAANIGVYGGIGNAVRSVFTIDGKTFDSNWFQSTGAAYNSEGIAIYDNASGHDFFTFNEQAAYKPIANQGAYGQILFGINLVDYLNPASSFTNFLTGTGIDQAITLGAADLANLETRSGSYTLMLYCGWQDDFGYSASGFCPEGVHTYSNGNSVDYFFAPTGTNQGNSPANGDTRAVITNAAGEFTLTSFNMQRVIDAPTGGNTVPEPGSLALLAASLLGLAGTRRLMLALY